jgi:sugar transferase (PEP-CTERM/EpsH1 system associated)
MNLLYLAHRIPYPPNKGDKIRAFRQLEWLSRRHRVWCACFLDDPADVPAVAALRRICHECAVVPLSRSAAALRAAAALPAGKTMTTAYYRHGSMQRILDRWCHEVSFDAVLAFSSSMAPYALGVPAPRRVLDLCDVDSQKWRDYAEQSRGPTRWLYRTEGRRLRRDERAWCALFDAVTLITDAEARTLDEHARASTVHVVGNGVDLPEDSMHPTVRARTHQPNESQRVVQQEVPVVGFVGVMNYRPNQDAVTWFCREVWPRIRAAFPKSVFRIVGRHPTRRVRELHGRAGVHVVGEVPNIGEEIRRFDVSVAPLRIARGIQNKVLEAMAHAKPVILSPSAAKGINAMDGVHFFTESSAELFARRAIHLLADPTERQRIGSAARAYVAAHHQWDAELTKLEHIVTGRRPLHRRKPDAPAPSRYSIALTAPAG